MGNARGIKAGRAYVELGTHDSKLMRGLRRAQARLKAFGAGVKSIGLKMGAIGGSVLAPLLSAAKVFAAAGDQLHKMSARTGVSAEALSELGFAAEQSGSNLETVEKGLRTMARTVNDAGRGLSTVTDALSDLGLELNQLEGLSPEQQFKLIGDKLSQIEDPGKRAAIAMMIFGRAGTQLLPMMQDGAAGMEELQKQARDLGLTISSETAADAAALTDAMNVAWRTLKNVAVVVGSALGPTLTDLATRAGKVTATITNWIKENKAIVLTIAKVAAGVVLAGGALLSIGFAAQAAAFAIGGIITILSATGSVAGVVAAAIGAMLSPIGLVVAAITGLGVTMAISTGVAGEAIDWLGKQFGRLRDFVGTVVGGISDALAAGDIAPAAKVLWSGLKLAWETGIQPLRTLWNDFRFAFASIGIEAFSALKKGWIEVSNWLWKSFPETTAFIARTWANLGATLQKVWSKFQNWLSDRWLDVMGMFDDSLDVEAAKQIGRDDLNSQLTDIETNRQAAVAEADRKAGRSDAEREAEKAAALAEVEAERVRALSKLEGEHAKRVLAAEQALEAAREALKNALSHAKQAKADAGEDLNTGKLTDKIADAVAGVTAAASKVSVVGTFNPAAIQGFAAGGAADRTAKATEQTARNTKRIVEQGRGGGAFT